MKYAFFIGSAAAIYDPYAPPPTGEYPNAPPPTGEYPNAPPPTGEFAVMTTTPTLYDSNANFSQGWDAMKYNVTDGESIDMNANGEGWDYVRNTQYNDGTVVTTMRQMFDDYFLYALDVRNGTLDSVPQCTVNTQCDDSGFVTKCCTRSVMYHPATNTKDVQYRCMNKGIAQFDLNMNLGDY